MAATIVQHLGTGRRKRSVARVILRPGEGAIKIDDDGHNFSIERAGTGNDLTAGEAEVVEELLSGRQSISTKNENHQRWSAAQSALPRALRGAHRGQVFVTNRGWIPVDPADVRKVVLEEKPQPTTLADPVVPAVRSNLFGAWEMNWLAYNDAHDVKLPGSREAAIPFLMYPQAENQAGFLDSLDPDKFKYRIIARELTT